MAEEYGVSLKITADTSDLETVPRKIEESVKSRPDVESVKVPVVADEVKVSAPKVDPVKVPVVADEVKVSAPKVDPVKVPVVADEVMVSAPNVAPVKVPVVADEVKVAAPNVAPVKVPVVADEVKVAAPKVEPVKPEIIKPEPVKPEIIKPDPVKPEVIKPAPIKIETEPVKVRVEVSDEDAKKRIEALTAEDGVKRIRVVTDEGQLTSRRTGKETFELDVDVNDAAAKRKIAELKKDQRFKITVDTSNAERQTSSFFSGIRKAVTSVRSSISTVFSAFGMVTFAVMGVQSLIAGFQKLKDKVTETSRAIAEMRWENWIGGFNASADALIGKHQRILDILRKEQDIASKAASIQSMEKAQNRAQDDQAREQVRAEKLAATTDPRERRRLEDQYAEEDDIIRRNRFEADKREKVRQLNDEENSYRSKQKGAQEKLPEIDRSIAEQEQAAKVARLSIQQNGSSEKKEQELADAQKRIEALKNEKKAIEQLIETMKREADYRAAQAKIVSESKAPESGRAAREAARKAQDERDRQDQADFERERGKSSEEDAFTDRMRKAERRASAPNATEAQRNEAENAQVEMLRGREQQADEQIIEAKKTLAEELAKPVERRSEKTITRAREDIRENEQTSRQSRRQREDIEVGIENRRVAQAQDYFGALARQVDVSRPQNRLTAIGLGSGGPADSATREQLSIARDISRQLATAIQAIRENKPTDSSATYAP